MSLAFTLFVARLTVLSSVVPVIAGLVGLARRPRPERLLWGFVVVVAGLNIMIAVLATRGIATGGISQLFKPLHIGLGVLATTSMLTLARRRRWLWWAFGGFMLVWGWRQGMALDAGSPFSTVIAPLGYWLLTACGMFLLIDRLEGSGHPAPLRDSVVVIALAMIVGHVVPAMIEPVAQLVWASSRNVVRLLYLPRAIGLILSYLLFTVAFLWTNPARSSSGSLSSAPRPSRS